MKTQSGVGITLAGGSVFSDFVTVAGAGFLPGITLAAFNSGFEGDPDQLLSIGEDLFTFALAENGTVLRATFVGNIVPEPGTLALLVGASALLGLRRRR